MKIYCNTDWDELLKDATSKSVTPFKKLSDEVDLLYLNLLPNTAELVVEL